jgi:hypothetical protein
VTWPNGLEVVDNEKRPAGKTIGDIKVEISNRKGELISKLPGSAAKKLLVELKIIWHCESWTVQTCACVESNHKMYDFGGFLQLVLKCCCIHFGKKSSDFTLVF